jgi:hypothetical protein
MENQRQGTLPDWIGLYSYRMTARIVGVLFLMGMVVSVVGNGLVQSILDKPDHLAAVPAHNMLLAIGAILMLMAAAFDAAHGILMLPVLKRHHEGLAFGYLGARMIDAVLLAIGVVFLLLQIPLGREYVKAGGSDTVAFQTLSTLSTHAHLYAYQIGMIAVGLAGFMLCVMFYWAALVPRLVASWGILGYTWLFGGAVVEGGGLDLHLLHTMVGGLWELFIGVWLIAKGFNAPTASSKRTTSSATPTVALPEMGAAVSQSQS